MTTMTITEDDTILARARRRAWQRWVERIQENDGEGLDEYLDVHLPRAVFGFEGAGLFAYRVPRAKAVVLPAEVQSHVQTQGLPDVWDDFGFDYTVARFITFEDAVALAVVDTDSEVQAELGRRLRGPRAGRKGSLSIRPTSTPGTRYSTRCGDLGRAVERHAD